MSATIIPVMLAAMACVSIIAIFSVTLALLLLSGLKWWRKRVSEPRWDGEP